MKLAVVILAVCAVTGTNARIRNARMASYDRARPGEFPYQVSLQVDGRHLCGGSLIGKKHILTAAHCVYDLIVNRVDKSRIKIAVGATTIPGGTLMEVDRIACHSSYIPVEVAPLMVADVAVIRLKKKIIESKYVRPIALPDPTKSIYDGQRLIISGFGSYYLGGPTSPVLNKLKLQAVNREYCQAVWPSIPIETGLFCAAAAAPGFGVCQGDSGGPLTIHRKIVVGIVSAGSNVACGSGTPDLYTIVSFYLDFIRSEMAMSS